MWFKPAGKRHRWSCSTQLEHAGEIQVKRSLFSLRMHVKGTLLTPPPQDTTGNTALLCRDTSLLGPTVTFLLQQLLGCKRRGNVLSFLSLPCRSLDSKDFAQRH